MKDTNTGAVAPSKEEVEAALRYYVRLHLKATDLEQIPELNTYLRDIYNDGTELQVQAK